ncbi:DUF4124 domain-containing protein [Lysobacter koreensis]|uniref:DUF4124 domain-containing protein n=1 Tax=Lysobacter koreensis TaxID=266122 RepID=A0ABW2YKY9_9GAMM
MRLAWAIVGGIVLGGGLAWWVARDAPAQAQRKQARAAAARSAQAQDARPVLYRWRDRAGVVHVTSRPPQGRDAGHPVERIAVEPREGIEVHGDRE